MKEDQSLALSVLEPGTVDGAGGTSSKSEGAWAVRGRPWLLAVDRPRPGTWVAGLCSGTDNVWLDGKRPRPLVVEDDLLP